MKISLIEFNKREDKVSMSISEFKKIEHLTRIGEATEKAFKHNGVIETRFFHDGELFLEDRFESIEELLEWYESEGNK